MAAPGALKPIDRGPERASLVSVFARLQGSTDAALVDILLGALASSGVGVCLCDTRDEIRYINAAFRRAIVPTMRDRPIMFVDAVADAIRAGQGIKLESMSLDAFAAHVKQRRATGPAQRSFAVDLADGRWFWVNDQRLADGWLLSVANEMSDMKREEAELRHAHASAVQEAQTDFLTGIATRRRGFERAEAALAASHANHLPLVIALLDIDHFKAVNDRHGHDVGDKVLVHFAQTVSALMRERDQFSRIGGEEFMLVMPETTAGRAQHLLTTMLADLPPFRMGDEPPLRLTASAGFAAATSADLLRDVVTRADAALYRAKAGGRHRVERASC